MVLAVAAIGLTELRRFCPPIGEKNLFLIPPGGYDFGFPYRGALALRQGLSPYLSPEQYYPPTYYLLTLPFTWLFGTDQLAASTAMYYFNLAMLTALAAVTGALLSESQGGRERFSELPFFCTVFFFGMSSIFLLERGQWDACLSLFCWAAVLAVLRGRLGWAIGLATVPTLAKGYSLLFLAGLLGLARTPAQRRNALVGVLIPCSVLLLPVARYLPIAWERTSAHLRFRLDPDWTNTGFTNLARSLFGSEHLELKWVFIGLTAIAATALWFQARRALHDERASGAERALWLSGFTSVSHATLTGVSSISWCFNLLFILPGMLLWALAHRKVTARLAISFRWNAVANALWLLLPALLLLYRVPGWKTFPLAALGVLLAVLLWGALAVRALRIRNAVPSSSVLRLRVARPAASRPKRRLRSSR